MAMPAATMSGSQHANPNAMFGQTPLPPHLTKEAVNQIYEKYQQMKSQGVRQDDPEFLKVRSILQNISAHGALKQQRLAFQQQQHQQLLHQQQQQHALPQQSQQNGDGQQPPFTANHLSPVGPPPTSTQDHPATSTAADGTVPPSDGQPLVSATTWPMFSDEQARLLRNQVTAFKLLSKNAPLPSEMQRMIFLSQQAKKSPTPVEALNAASSTLDEVVNGNGTVGLDGIAETEPGSERNGYKTFKSPYDYLQKDISYAHHSRRDRRPMIPSILPPGVDVDRLREERENIIYNRIQHRKAELEKLSANMGSWDTTKTDTPQDDGSAKRRALIEYKMLNLLPKQRVLRQQIGREMITGDSLAMTANRSMYRRHKKHDIREARFTEKLEKEQRTARENKEKKKHIDYLKAILAHAEEVHKAAKEQRARIQKFGRMMIAQHQTIEKDEQKRIERTARQRLQALKANDEETYLKLLGQAKDTRISHLLKQTDGFLNQLAASVKQQQRAAAERYTDKDLLPDEVESEHDDEDDEDGGRKVDYYEVAHRIKEEVVQQSSNLVGGTLKEYQVKGLQWMLSLYNNNLNGILADEMGLGKTIQTISLITYLIEKKKQPGPFLVIVPLSTLTNWNSEFDKWAPSVNKIVYKGPPNSRKLAQNLIRSGQFQVLLTTYEFIIKDRPVLSKVKWLHMIVDEGHRMKNAGSKLSSTITHFYNTRYRLILTGTPLQNNLPELWALLNFVLPNIFKSVKSFDEWFNTPFANTGTQDKMDLTEEEQILVIRRLHKVLRPFLLRRLKKDVEKDLPDKQERVVKCNFSALQAKLYSTLLHHNKLMVSDGKGGKTGVRGLSNMLMQLRKLCNHPFVFEEVEDQVNPQRTSNDLLWRTSGKFELLDRILPKFRATGHRVLMFFQMTQIMNIMEDFLRLRNIPYLRLDGSTKADERADLLKLYNAPNSPYFIFLLSTRAGGLGLNLQTADTVIIYDSDWNPHQDLQAQDRAHRIGQKNEVRILRLISSKSVEEKILERAQFKLDMDGKVIQAGKFDNKSTNEERDAMLRVMLETAEAAEDLEQEEMDDDDLNAIMMRSEEEMVIFQRMDEERARDPIYGTGKKPRLLPENELPEIYLTDDNPVVDEIEEVTGRGARERTRVKYDDGLTEEQWLEAVDNDEDTIEAAIARKQSRISKRATNKEKRVRGENDLGDSPMPDRDSSESPAPMSTNKKRGRKPVPTSRDKRKADEASLDGDSVIAAAREPARKRGRGRVLETLSNSQRTALQDVLNRVFAALNDLEEESPDAGIEARPIIDPFIKLPDRKLYADYYVIIQNPICMEQIEKKVNGRHYQSCDGFMADVALLCNNCKTYNEDGSVLYRDAGIIEDTAHTLLSKETTSHASALGPAGLSGTGAGTGTATSSTSRFGSTVGDPDTGAPSATASGAATPASGVAATSTGGTKLKLNWGGNRGGD